MGILRSLPALWYFCYRKRQCDFCKVIDHVCMNKKRGAAVTVALSCRCARGTNILTRLHDLGDVLVRAKFGEAHCSPSARLLSLWKVTPSLPQAPIMLPAVIWIILTPSTELWGGEMWTKVWFSFNFSLRQERLKQRWNTLSFYKIQSIKIAMRTFKYWFRLHRELVVSLSLQVLKTLPDVYSELSGVMKPAVRRQLNEMTSGEPCQLKLWLCFSMSL